MAEARGFFTSVACSTASSTFFDSTFTHGQVALYSNSPQSFDNVALSELLGDTNGDGTVNLTDLNAVLNHLGQNDSLQTDGNFDGAPSIDLTDLNDVLNNLGMIAGTFVGTTAESNVPEPASLTLLSIGAAALLRRQRAAR